MLFSIGSIHPGQDIRWNEEDRSLLLQKFESMYQLGVRGFAVFFDDISGEGTKADKQAELLNYIDDHFVKSQAGCCTIDIVSHRVQQVMDRCGGRLSHYAW